VAFSVVLLDQSTKWAARDFVGDGVVHPWPFLALRRSENTGAAWSAFSGHANALAVLGIVVLVSLLLGRRHFTTFGQKFSIALVFGGILGNTIDRIFRGHVVDFIDFSLGSYHWPTFNLADGSLCIGVAILLFTFHGKGQEA
jgi:signal peptidase II